MSRINNYDGAIPIQDSDLPLFISLPTDNAENIAYTIVMTIMVFPFIVTDMYYAYNDDSCVNSSFRDDMKVELRDYLIVSSYSGIFGIIGAFICIYYESIIYRPRHSFLPVLKTIFILFNLSWTVIGGIVFWGTDVSQCTNGIYTYFCFIWLKVLWCAYTLNKILFD